MESCTCGATPNSAQQSMAEMEFQHSACYAALQGDLKRLRKVLEKRPGQIESDGKGMEGDHQMSCGANSGGTGHTPLIYAARAGHVDIVRYLLSKGANVNRKTTGMQATALHRAAGQGNVEIVKLLLEYGADPCAQDCDGETPLHKAGKGSHKEVYDIIIQKAGKEKAEHFLDKNGHAPRLLQ